MEKIYTIENLLFFYDLYKDVNFFDCVCEKCKANFSISRVTIYRKRKEDKLNNLYCKSCNCQLSKLSYSDERKKEILKKRTKTNLQKYGCENTWQLEKVKQISHSNWNFRKEKIEQAMIKKYGVKNCMQSTEIKMKAQETAQKNDPHYKKRVKKMQETNLKRRGHISNFQDENFHDESIKKQIERYGRPIYSRTYIYNNLCFDSSWELAYYIWLTDTKQEFQYQPEVDFKYIGSDEKEHRYYPDFFAFGEYQEIKGNQFFNENNEPYDTINKKYWWEKYNCAMQNGVHILRWEDLKPIMNYVHTTYGKDYLKSFKVKVKKD